MIIFNGPEIRLSIPISIIYFCLNAAGHPVENDTSAEDMYDLFRLANGTVPEYHLVRISLGERSKRMSKDMFTLSFYAWGQFIKTKLRKIKNDPIVGSNTGLWTAHSDQRAFHSVVYNPRSDVLNEIGEMMFYQDKNKGSAITFFHDSDNGYVMNGVLCENYSINYVPRKYENKILANWQLSSAHAIQRSVNIKDIDTEDEIIKNKSEEALYAIFNLPHDPHENINDELLSPEFEHNRKKRQVVNPVPTSVYPKVLVTLHGDNIWSYNITTFLKYIITFWNTVDMIFRKLKQPAVRLSLAGFIIPQDEYAAPYIRKNTSTMDSISAPYILYGMGKYFDDENIRFPRDKYDIIIAMTKGQLCSKLYGPSCNDLAGQAWSSSACERHQMNSTFVYGGLGVVEFDFLYKFVSVAAHELGHILGVEGHDSDMTSKCSNYNGNLMTAKTTSMANLQWSSCSIDLMRSFLQSNAASCLHNKPIAISPLLKDFPGTWLSPMGQCHNFYIDAHMNPHSCYLPIPDYANRCKTLKCMISYKCVEPLVTPLNGSSCIILPQTEGYCFEGQCIQKP